MLSQIEQTRRNISKTTDVKRKSRLGQFFTPAPIARFMTGLFTRAKADSCCLLDAGAGIGSLCAAFLDNCVSGGFEFNRVELDAFEIDKHLHPHLAETLEGYQGALNLTATIKADDFVLAAAESLGGALFTETLPKYTHAILNPPYKKISARSLHRLALRRIGIETVNLYTAFVALSLALLEPGGELVAIIPRSFCNGPYYRPFREYILRNSAIVHLHLFESRNRAFKDDQVLQENLILLLKRSSRQGGVRISTSADERFADITTYQYPFDQIVPPNSPERFLYIPSSPQRDPLKRLGFINSSLTELGISVSTGPVVDFRLKDQLSFEPKAGTVPLLYPGHLKQWTLNWPDPEHKKPNAIQRNPNTEKWLYPNGFYCLVRRFSSKEERRRIFASIVKPDDFDKCAMIGFENHLNVFHQNKQGLPKALAYGLVAYLNSTPVDESFRRFNGHTQVNATDLKAMPYPDIHKLLALGEWAIACKSPDQKAIDEKVENLGR